MKNFFIICTLTFSANIALAQFKFLAPNASDQYKAKIIVANGANRTYGGKATIILYDKIEEKEIQIFSSPELDFSLTEKQITYTDWLELGKYQTPLVFGDFNFDGLEDLAIRNGSKGAYESPSYDVYLASKGNKFILDKGLTKLASENLGMFSIDKKSKLISIEQKDGRLYHKTINYAFDAKKGLKEVSFVIEDATIGDDVIVIKQKIVGGKTERNIQKFKIKDYYTEEDDKF